MTNEKTKWRITAEDPPPEYSFLEGRNAVGDNSVSLLMP